MKGELIMAFSALLAALSQTLLKLSARKHHSRAIYEYLNVRVITAYGLLALSMVLNLFAFRSVDYKWGPIIASTSYIYVLIIGYFVLKEKLSLRKALGSILIIFGIIVFSL